MRRQVYRHNLSDEVSVWNYHHSLTSDDSSLAPNNTSVPERIFGARFREAHYFTNDTLTFLQHQSLICDSLIGRQAAANLLDTSVCSLNSRIDRCHRTVGAVSVAQTISLQFESGNWRVVRPLDQEQYQLNAGYMAIIACAANGLTRPEIMEQTGLPRRTIDDGRRDIYDTWDVTDMTGAVLVGYLSQNLPLPELPDITQ